METRLINFRIETQMVDELKLIALKKKITMQKILTGLIEDYISRNQKFN